MNYAVDMMNYAVDMGGSCAIICAPSCIKICLAVKKLIRKVT
jgi:hypothetical protein